MWHFNYHSKMPRYYQKLQKLLTFDNLIRQIDRHFQEVVEHRRSNRTYVLTDVLKSAFAMFSLKSPSLLSFREQTRVEHRNLKQIYRIGQIPADTQMRTILDAVEPEAVRDLFPQIFARLSDAGVVKEYKYHNRNVIVSVDGAEHFNSNKIHCANCTTKTRRDGTSGYSHSALAAVVVHPEQKEVMPIEFEPILCQDGAEKNDCERTAAKVCLRFWFEEMSSDKLFAASSPNNGAARRVLEKIGMRYVGQSAHYRMELVTYSISRNEYRTGNCLYKLMQLDFSRYSIFNSLNQTNFSPSEPSKSAVYQLFRP